MSKTKKPFHEVVAEKLIEQLKAGTAPWQKPWNPGEPNAYLPMNPTTGNRYKGINAIHLMAQGRDDSRWMTYNQAAAAGAQVRKGERGTGVQYWKFHEEQTKRDDQGKPVMGKDGKPEKVRVPLERPRVFFATVFNAEQIDGLPPQQQKPVAEQQWNAVERAEHILAASGAKITHAEGDRAFYRPSTDTITLPEKSQFDSADSYYATALHELGHWTGHPSRLDRDLANPFGSEGYAKEELRAEIASMILGDELGIGHDPGQHVAYVESWVKVLQEDSMEIFRAAADAEKIHNFVLAFEQKQVVEQTQTQEQEAQLQETHQQQQEPQVATPQIQSQKEGGDLVAEQWVLRQIEQGTFNNSFDSATVEQVEKAQAVLNSMLPLNTGNELWQRNELPEDVDALESGIHKSIAFLDERQANMLLAAKNEQKEQLAEELVGETKQPQKAQRQYIDVPFTEKNEAKDLGARWDRQEKSWYVPGNLDIAQFSKWTGPVATEMEASTVAVEAKQPEQSQEQKREYLAVPYGEREAAKAAGAQWDKAAKSWYVGANADMERLERWKPENVQSDQGPAMSPQEEFADALRSMGCVVAEGHPIMDGKPHRINVEGDRKGEKAGFYVGHLDGHPAGYVKNNRTGVDMKWKSKGYSLDPAEKAKLQAEAAAKLEARAKEQERLQEATAQRVTRQATELDAVTEPTTYIKNKSVQVHDGVLTDKEGQKTYIPAIDADGKQWSMQYIQEDGTKRFAKDSRKEGCFHPVGGMEAIAAAPALIIAEGYATAAQVAEAAGQPVVAAFDSGNLESVARALSAKFPDKPVIVAGDDDRHLELTQGINPGRSKAEEAAKAVGGKAIFPVFATGENSYPADLPVITPQLYREHERAARRLESGESGQVQLAETEVADLKKALLNEDQLQALSNMKSRTDFNDLATKSSLGRDGVERQVSAAVTKVVQEAERKAERKQELVEKQEQKLEKKPRRSAKVG